MNKVEDVKNFVSKELRELKQHHKLLELHICACEVLLETNKGASERLMFEHSIIKKQINGNEIMKFLEFSIIRQTNPWQILQLICLWSICDDGISTKHFHHFRNLFLHSCGYEYLPILYSLQLNGLLIEKNVPINLNPIVGPFRGTGKTSFSQIVKNMNLTTDSDESFDAKTSTKPSYVFSDAYIPLMVQLLTMTMTDGWNQTKLSKLLGPDIPVNSTPNITKLDNRIKKAILIVFIGGITFSEIASIRQFSQNNNFRIIILTSHILNREEFLKSFSETI